LKGTFLAQLFSFILMPIISRFYTEEDFADLGVYTRIITFVSAIATARFELSLPLPKSEYHSFLLYRLSLKISKYILIICLIVFVFFLLYLPFSFNFLFFSFICLASLYFLVFINLGTNWSIRKKDFKAISNQRIINSVSTNIFKILLGFKNLGGLGLVLATFLGYFISSFNFLKNYNYQNKKHNHSSIKTNLLVKEYKNFPLISLPHVLLDLGRDLFIGFVIVYNFDKSIFGSFAYAIMILTIPLSFIGNSVGQVFFNKCSEMVNSNKSISELMRKTYLTLFLISILPFVTLFFVGEEIFVFVFGQNWRVAGQYSEIMSIWFMINFIVSPMTNLPLILNRQKENLVFGIANTLIQIFVFGLLPFFVDSYKNDFESTLKIASFILTFYYLIIGYYLYKLSYKGRLV
jgi:O-antigen/teichoic acid export membrane protein